MELDGDQTHFITAAVFFSGSSGLLPSALGQPRCPDNDKRENETMPTNKSYRGGNRSRRRPLIPEPSPRFLAWALGLGGASALVVALIEMAYRGHV
jgi:hypothetical protein